MKNIVLLITIILLTGSCAKNTYLPKPEDLNYYTKGMWLECELPDGSNINGELLALNNTNLHLLPDTGQALTLNKKAIKEGILRISLTTNHPEKLKSAGLIPLITFAHGWFMPITMTINLAIVIPTVATHRSGSYVVLYPKEISWKQMSKFARFPQGLPEGIDINSLSYIDPSGKSVN